MQVVVHCQSVHWASCPSLAIVALLSLRHPQDHPLLLIAELSIAKLSIHHRDVHHASCPLPRLSCCRWAVHCHHVASLAIHHTSYPLPSRPSCKLSISCSINHPCIAVTLLISIVSLLCCLSPSRRTIHWVSCPLSSCPSHGFFIIGHCHIAVRAFP